MDLVSVEIRKLPHKEYIEYMKGYLHIIDDNDPVVLNVEDQFNVLTGKVDDIEDIYKLNRASELTQVIADLDVQRDRYLIGISSVVNGYLDHYDASKVQAAQSLRNTIAVYGTPSYIARESLSGQSTTLTHLTEELQGDPTLSAAVAALGLAPWVAELKRVNDELRTAYWQRTAEVGDLPTAKIVDLRLTSNALYYQLRDKLLAYALLAGYAPPYDAVINKINALIAQYNVTLARGSAPGDVD